MQLEEIREPSESVSAPTELQLDVAEHVVEIPASRRSEKISRAPERFMFLTVEQRDVLLLDNDEPKTYDGGTCEIM